MNSTSRVYQRRDVVVGLALGSVLVSSACDAPGSGEGDGATPAPPAPAASVSFSVPDGKTDVAPDQRLSVRVAGGDLVTVRLTDARGTTVPGRVVRGVWTVDPATRLVPRTSYTWNAAARNAEGKLTRQQVEFRTLTPKISATYTVMPDGATVGVGMPAMVTFDSSVTTPEARADVQKRLKIKVVPAQKGSWGWLDDRQLMWRPDAYWKPGTKVTVSAPLTGVATGPGKWITKDKGGTFTVADRARVMKVDLAGHSMTVTDDGKRVATYPISAGRPGASWETRSGTKVITEKHADYVMDSATLGLAEDDPNYYRTEVKYAMRVTNTGEFLHSAPWSVWAQGRQNVSHGCVNLGPSAAAEVFRTSIIGDVVEFTGSSRRMKPGDGLSVWLFSPSEWRARSALRGQKPTARATSTPRPDTSSASSEASSQAPSSSASGTATP